MSPAEAIKIQHNLSGDISRVDSPGEITYIAGVDVSLGRFGGTGRASVVVLKYPSLEVTGESTFEGLVPMPYIPGLLSFRELPLILPALQNIAIEPDLLIVDGHGIAHPRRLGIAAHLGLFTNKPVIGCAKSRLCGTHSDVGPNNGDYAELVTNCEVIGRVIRTREGSKPVFVSVGNHISLETATDWVLKLCAGHRLPEPVRQAHLAAGRKTEPVLTYSN